jgi:plasmid stabilization system protein ParE
MILTPEAARDVLDAVWWYEEQRDGLGVKFRSQLDTVLTRIDAMPELYRVVYQRARRALMSGFPFSVYYSIEDGEVVVFAVVHSRRDPESWRSRL